MNPAYLAQLRAGLPVPAAPGPAPEPKTKPAPLSLVRPSLDMQLRYVTDPVEARQRVQQLLAEPVLGIDIETTGLDPLWDQTRLISVATLDGRVAVFDMFRLHSDVLHPLSQVPWCAFNAGFEYRFLRALEFQMRPLHDAQLIDRLHHHLMHRNLAAAVQDTLGLALPKEEQRSDWSAPELSHEQLEYAGRDALAALRVAHELLPKIPQPVYTVWRNALPVLADLELRGQTFDFTEHGRMVEQWQRESAQLLQDLRMHLGAGIKPTSGPQIGEWLKQHLPAKAIQAWPKTATGRLKTDAQTLQLFGDLPAVAPLLKFKRVSKLLSTYGEKYAAHKHDLTGRLHPSFKVGMTVSGRVCASKPNTQNPPRVDSFRALFVPPSDCVLIGADYGQIELRVAALLSGDRAMIQAYERGDDLHRLTAAAVAGVAPESVTKEQRQAAKAVNFGTLYGQGPAGLASNAQTTYGITMTKQEAAQALQRFDMAYPTLAAWKRQQIGLAHQQHRVTTRLGLVREFEIQGTGYLQGEAVNIPVQGSAAEVLLAAMGHLPAALKGTSAALYHNVHDELVLACKPEDAEQAAAALTDAMTAGFLQVFPEGEALTKDLVETKIGRSWADVH